MFSAMLLVGTFKEYFDMGTLNELLDLVLVQYSFYIMRRTFVVDDFLCFFFYDFGFFHFGFPAGFAYRDSFLCYILHTIFYSLLRT